MDYYPAREFKTKLNLKQHHRGVGFSTSRRRAEKTRKFARKSGDTIVCREKSPRFGRMRSQAAAATFALANILGKADHSGWDERK